MGKKNKDFFLDWPENSPDLNPIENLWEIAKRRVCSGETITRKQQLIEKLIEVWQKDPETKAKAQTCIESIPRRIDAAIKDKGGVTRY